MGIILLLIGVPLVIWILKPLFKDSFKEELKEEYPNSEESLESKMEELRKDFVEECKVLEVEREEQCGPDKTQVAIEKTKKAQNAFKEIENILRNSIKIVHAIDWDSLLDKKEFSKQKPDKPSLLVPPPEPKPWAVKYRPQINYFLNSLLPKLQEKKIKEVEDLFKNDHSEWQKEKIKIEERNKTLIKNYEDENLSKWEKEKEEYLKKREEKNKKILERKEKYQKYLKKQPDAIVDYCEIILTASKYPDTFPQQYNFDYNPESKILIVDYFLPLIENIPRLKEVKYIASRDEFKETYLSDAALNKLYDNVLYQITLRTIFELYKVDEINALASIVFNGFVRFIDKGTGKEAIACILSIQTQKDEFFEINLANVDPKTCFKTLKGVGSSKLYGLAPIAPIAKINREDKRFVTPYDVADTVDERTNLAAMDWKDFENLIREIFEKEFSIGGGEVKITQASRDKGVDAVAFDPDPIRGGKIVIQAKRYTNIVGVSAVRDLYGTVVNEGAMKGILVTTTDYGPDAYHFAKDKPLTLLNGSNLLHMLEKYGHKAKIDIKEAKKILGEKEKTYYD